MDDAIPPEAFLATFTEPIRVLAEALRDGVRGTLPDAIERVRPGWRLIGYDAPLGRRSVYFAWIWPEGHHVHLGFQNGVLMSDPDGRLHGAGITRKVRWLTYTPGDTVDVASIRPLIVEAHRIAVLPRAERFELAMRREAEDEPVERPRPA